MDTENNNKLLEEIKDAIENRDFDVLYIKSAILIKNYEALSKRFGRVVTQSDRQQRNIIELNDKLEFTNKHLEQTNSELIKAHNHIREYLNIIEKKSITDELTGLYNRRYFNQTLEKKLAKIRTNEEILVFYMLDIDYFKLYNDNYGHVRGDMVLQQLGQLLSQLFQKDRQYSFRIGGEEFALLSIVKNIEEALDIAKLIIDEIKNLKITHKHSKVANVITASMGIRIVNFNENDISPELIHSQADQALYVSKQNGRNRYSVYRVLE